MSATERWAVRPAISDNGALTPKDPPMKHAPLTEADYQRLSSTLQRFARLQCMNLEKLDGFFTALLCGPEAIKPTECLPLILGDAFDDEQAFRSEKDLEKFVALLMGHWLDIAHTLQQGAEFQPWLDADEQGVVHGNDWAEGFVEGMQLQQDDWNLLFDDAEHAAALEAIMALAFERHPDPEMRPYIDNSDSSQREQWLAAISPAVQEIHQFFAAIRAQMEADLEQDALDPEH